MTNSIFSQAIIHSEYFGKDYNISLFFLYKNVYNLKSSLLCLLLVLHTKRILKVGARDKCLTKFNNWQSLNKRRVSMHGSCAKKIMNLIYRAVLITALYCNLRHHSLNDNSL